MIVILSHKGDLHALAVQEALLKQHRARCHVVETDDQVQHGAIAWQAEGNTFLTDREGIRIPPAEIRTIWYRRSHLPQRGIEESFDNAEARFITIEWCDAIFGLLSAESAAVWINDPSVVERAESKIVQLRAAERLGLRTPRTFIGQDHEAACEFFSTLASPWVAVKKLRGTPRFQTQTLKISVPDLEDDPHTMRLCPAIYQEVIEGREHLRIHVFGDRVVAICVATDTFDWRTNLHADYRPYELPPEWESAALALTRKLGLRMAIIDAKIATSGELVWLEVNQQGQFLFMEGLSGVNLTATMADFLSEAAA